MENKNNKPTSNMNISKPNKVNQLISYYISKNKMNDLTIIIFDEYIVVTFSSNVSYISCISAYSWPSSHRTVFVRLPATNVHVRQYQ